MVIVSRCIMLRLMVVYEGLIEILLHFKKNLGSRNTLCGKSEQRRAHILIRVCWFSGRLTRPAVYGKRIRDASYGICWLHVCYGIHQGACDHSVPVVVVQRMHRKHVSSDWLVFVNAYGGSRRRRVHKHRARSCYNEIRRFKSVLAEG